MHRISIHFIPNLSGDPNNKPNPPEIDGKDSMGPFEIATYCLAAILGYFLMINQI